MDKNTNGLPKNGGKESSGLPIWVTVLLAVVGFLYLLNPTAGVLEILPDNLPIVGNLDEGAAAILVWQDLQLLMKRKKSK